MAKFVTTIRVGALNNKKKEIHFKIPIVTEGSDTQDKIIEMAEIAGKKACIKLGCRFANVRPQDSFPLD